MSPRLRPCAFALWLFLAGSAAAWPQAATGIRLSAGRQSVETGRIYLFSNVAVGARSNPVTFTLTNAGSSALTLGRDAVTLSGRDRTMFAVVGQPAAPLPAGASAAFRIVFAPTQAGPFMAAVSVAAAEGPRLISFWVAGNGVPSD